VSWWLIAIAAFVLLRLSRRRGWESRALRGWPGYFPGPVQGSWRAGGGTWLAGPAGSAGRAGRTGREPQATSPSPRPARPDPRREGERTLEALRREYVTGRIEVEEYERKLDELYRTAEGRRLAGS
jgi:hypothetical protein